MWCSVRQGLEVWILLVRGIGVGSGLVITSETARGITILNDYLL